MHADPMAFSGHLEPTIARWVYPHFGTTCFLNQAPRRIRSKVADPRPLPLSSRTTTIPQAPFALWAIVSGPGASSDYLNLSLTLNADRTFQLGSGSALTINGVLGGPGGFTKAGTGALFLRGANTYAGPTLVSEGPLYVEHPSALGSTAGGTT